MFRVCKLSGKYYGAEFEYDDDDMLFDSVNLALEGTPVIIGETLEDIAKLLNISVEDIN